MNNWIAKNKIISLGIVAAFSLILYLVSLFNVFGEIKKIEDSYHNSEPELSKEKKFVAIKYITESNKESIQTIRDFFIKKGDEVAFIKQIENIARASSIKSEISSIDIKENQSESLKEDVKIKMSVEGSWLNVMSFISKLEKMSFGVLIQNINLDANAPGHWTGSVGFNIFREK